MKKIKKPTKKSLLTQFENEYLDAKLFEIALDHCQTYGDSTDQALSHVLKVSIEQAHTINQMINGLDGDQHNRIVEQYSTDNVINKYMEMDTDLFDADDLENIITKIEEAF